MEGSYHCNQMGRGAIATREVVSEGRRPVGYYSNHRGGATIVSRGRGYDSVQGNSYHSYQLPVSRGLVTIATRLP